MTQKMKKREKKRRKKAEDGKEDEKLEEEESKEEDEEEEDFDEEFKLLCSNSDLKLVPKRVLVSEILRASYCSSAVSDSDICLSHEQFKVF